jgi:hypothetical protein
MTHRHALCAAILGLGALLSSLPPRPISKPG